MVMTDMTKFHILDQNSLVPPGKCVGCGTIQGTFLDLGLELDFYGVVYLCVENCLTEVANAMDYYTPKQWRLVNRSNEELRNENNKLKDENEALNGVMDSLNQLRVMVSTPNYVDSANMEYSEESESTNREPDQLVLHLTEAESGSIEQVNEQGSPDVLSDDSIDEFLGLGDRL